LKTCIFKDIYIYLKAASFLITQTLENTRGSSACEWINKLCVRDPGRDRLIGERFYQGIG
jgi:hypothetical protein